MKKLFKQEWKYYLLFLLAMLVLLFAREGRYYNKEVVDQIVISSYSDLQYDNQVMNGELWWWIGGYVCNIDMISGVLPYVLMGILAVKAVFFWLEKDSYGREFIFTLPVKRIDRMRFHLVMDSLLIVISVVVFTTYMYWQVDEVLTRLRLVIPWMAPAIFGEMLTCIAYLLFLLGLINVLECMFAGGFLRIVGIAVSFFAGFEILRYIFRLNDGIKWIQNLYGYFALESVGGCYYQTASTGNYKFGAWVHEVVNCEVYCKGKPVKIAGNPLLDDYIAGNISRLADFSNVSSYIGYVLGYLALAVVLMGIAAYLVKQQEVSKQDFYFVFGRYLLCAMISGYFMLTVMVYAVAAWHKYVIVASGIVVYLLLNYCMAADRMQYFKKKQSI